MLTQAESQNLSKIIDKVQNDPYLLKALYDLCPRGANYPTAIVDEGDCVVDPARLQEILLYNSFRNEYDFNEKLSICEPLPFKDESGVWLFPSYFNHSCLPNTKKIVISDFMMIYSSK
jgi:hypothetical protein